MWEEGGPRRFMDVDRVWRDGGHGDGERQNVTDEDEGLIECYSGCSLR